jgi:hypothetical protein
MKVAGLFVIATVLTLHAGSEPGSVIGPVFRVDFTNPGLSPPHWTLTIRPDGSGHFSSERGTAPTVGEPEIEAPSVDRDIRLSQGFAEHIFQTAHHHKWSGGDCESHMKVAFQGWKKLSYDGPEGQGICEFNYSKDKDIQALGDSLVSVATTIVEGAKLESLLQNDRLGLDQEMQFLAEAAGDGRAQQICTIRGILERLSEDDGVMERVKKRARMLLVRAEE